jgi:uncharacterized protein (TIGR02453 family)
MEKVIQFLKDLAANNNREWFNANRDRYEESRQKMLFLTEVFINEIRRFDPSIPALNPKDCMFRIFRDIRFSKDKRPYKTNFGSFISRHGRKSEWPGYYFHIEPENSFAGGGVYHPSAEPLKAIRQHINDHPEEFIRIINNPDFKSYFPRMYDHQLKTAPKGFQKDHPYIQLLRYKSFVFSHRIDNEIVTGGGLVEYTVGVFKQMFKVSRFLGEALEYSKNKIEK